jgi:hypothetical protein
MAPPTSASSSDSSISDTTTAPLPKPSARSVAISRVRAATALYIVFSAPNTAPMAIKNAIRKTERRDQPRHGLGLLGVIIGLPETFTLSCGFEVSESLNAWNAPGEFSFGGDGLEGVAAVDTRPATPSRRSRFPIPPRRRSRKKFPTTGHS